jgi:nitric oxide dioxygenase
MRNYSLSNRPGDEYYRISVKRETATQNAAPQGLVSNFLHDQIAAGDTIWVGPPCGEFTIRTPAGRPMVMIAGGVGITPLLSMLHASLNNEDTSQVTLIQAAVNGDALAFADEIAELKQNNANFDWHIRYSEPTDNDRYLGRFHSEGLIDEDLIDLVDKSADFYLCGPAGMMQHCHHLLRQAGVPTEQIHLEAFGPALQLAG